MDDAPRSEPLRADQSLADNRAAPLGERITPERLRDAISAGQRHLKPQRDALVDAYRATCGRYHPRGDPNAPPKYLNLERRYLDVMIPYLAAREPTHTVTTKYAAMAGQVKLLELALNKTTEDLQRLQVSRQVVQEALLGCAGIVKVGIKTGSEMYTEDGVDLYTGQVYIRRVPFSRYFCDAVATCEENIRFEGEYYDVPREEVAASGLIPPEILERVPSVDDEVEEGEGLRIEDEGDTEDRRKGRDLIDQIELMDVYLRMGDGRTVKIVMTRHPWPDEQFLIVEEWQGHGRGPYVKLQFKPDLDHVFGTPPIAALREQADAFYAISRKMIDDIVKTKRIMLSNKGTSKKDVEAVNNAVNGDHISVDDVNAFMVAEFGGTSQWYGEVLGMLYGWFNTAAGNADILAGSGAATDKATIFQGLAANANVLVTDMQETHARFEDEVSSRLKWHLLNDPLIKLPLTYRAPGGEHIQLMFTTAQRRDDAADYTVKVTRQSMVNPDPNAKMAVLQALIQLVMQAAQVEVSTGLVSAEGAATIAAHATGFDELQQLVRAPGIDMGLAEQLAAIGGGPGLATPPAVPGGGMGVQSARGGARQTGPGASGASSPRMAAATPGAGAIVPGGPRRGMTSATPTRPTA